MRWVHLAIVGVFALAMLIFLVQNWAIVTLTLLGFSVRAPIAILAAGVYLIGALTGGSLLALLRRSYAGAQGVAGTPH